jgi:hypothetical protein
LNHAKANSRVRNPTLGEYQHYDPPKCLSRACCDCVPLFSSSREPATQVPTTLIDQILEVLGIAAQEVGQLIVAQALEIFRVLDPVHD